MYTGIYGVALSVLRIDYFIRKLFGHQLLSILKFMGHSIHI